MADVSKAGLGGWGETGAAGSALVGPFRRAFLETPIPDLSVRRNGL